MVKLTNAFRDVNIAFANELSVVAEQLHVNVWELISRQSSPAREYPAPRSGRGRALHRGRSMVHHWAVGDAAKIMRAGRETNDCMPHWVVRKAKAAAIASAHQNCLSGPIV